MALKKLDTGQLEKMTIYAFEDAKLQKQKGKPFVVMFNPTTFSVNHTHSYDQYPPKPGPGESDQKEKHRNPRTLSLELFFDGTRVSPLVGKSKDLETLTSKDTISDSSGLAGTSDDLVDRSVELFLKTTHEYDKNMHRTPYLVFVWGTFIFPGVLESANVTHSLFTSSGKSLRAKVSLSVKEHITEEKLNRLLNQKSPDLTQSRTIISGDTLPNLAKAIYGDEKLYIELAKANKLNNYRHLKSGSQLVFPPIEKLKKA